MIPIVHSMDTINKWCRKRSMPPRLETGTPTERVQIIAPRSWLARIDEWRRKQPSIPSRSEAIRLLVDLALATGKD